MTDLPEKVETAKAPGRPRLRRVLRVTLYVKLALALLLGLGTGILYLRLSAGPMNVDGMTGRVAAALAARIGPGWTVRLSDTALELSGWTPALRASGLDIRNPDGVLVMRAPYAIVSLDPMSLTTGSLALRSIELRELHLRATLGDDGALSFVPPSDETDGAAARPVATRTAPAAASADGARRPSKVSTAVASLFDLAFEPTSVVAALDDGRITGASLTLIDSDGRERVAFSRVNASFERVGEKRRRFAMSLEGPRGPWQLAGDVGFAAGGATRLGRLTLRELPIHDLLLLSGMSRLPGNAELTVSGEVSAALAGGRLTELKGRLATSRGVITIDDPDTPPIRVDAASAEAVWDEDRQVMALHGLSFEGGDTRVRLEGELSPSASREGWDLSLTGRDALVSGAGEGDAPFTIAEVAAEMRIADGGVIVQHLALTGEELGLTVSGSYGTSESGGGLRAAVDARNTDARRLLRLWPAAMAADVRRYLIANTRAGRVVRLALSAAASPAEIRDGLRGLPLPDSAFEVEFSLDKTSLLPAEGLPTIRDARAAGVASGHAVAVRVDAGEVRHDNRSMSLSEGTFRMRHIPNGEAQVSFRLGGTAEAFAGLLQAPTIRNAAPISVDPSTLKGRADLRFEIPFSLKNAPEIAEIPIIVGGTLSDIAVERAFGREKLEAQSLTLAYDRTGFSLKGDARLGGLPATLDLRQGKTGAGEVSVSMVLDEAARARRGLSFGGQISGPVSVRAVIPLPRTDRSVTALDVDFSKASADNVLPGWSKLAGKPGHASFSLREGEGTTEVTDLVVDSAPLLIKGSLSLAESGAEKFDFQTFKISPGDELKVQGERSGGLLKVLARGNVADARPFLRQISVGAAAKAPPGAQPDIDLDLSANILAGFNDEALTGATVKLSLRNREVRQLQLQGRFRAAPVSAQISSRDRGPPLLLLRSGDAGAALRFVDLYRRMIGGDLGLRASLDNGVQDGLVEISSFELRNEPALKSIISQQPVGQGGEERGGAQLSKLDVDEVHFTKLRSEFVRSASRVEIRDAAIWGPQVGFKLGGFVDYARDRADISGTFVPAYGLNNVFSQVPVVGMILGGGQNEGLFAINFRIHGAPSAPTLVVNPLSAVAPGIFRKLFGTGGPVDTTGTTTPFAPER